MERTGRDPIHGFGDLEVYQRGYRLALAVHKESNGWREAGYHTIGDQLRGAAWSVPSNIAEGYGRKIFEKDFKRMLITALGSVNEVLVFLDAARDLGWLNDGLHATWRDEYELLARQLQTLIQRWQTY